MAAPDNSTLTATEARAILEQAAQTEAREAQERLKQYGEAMNKLSDQFQASLQINVVLPDGETVSLVSWLKSIGANATPSLGIVSKYPSGYSQGS